VEFLAEQLEIGNASCVKKYVQRPQTPYEHAGGTGTNGPRRCPGAGL